MDYIVTKYRRLKWLQLGFTSYYDTSEFAIYYDKLDLYDYMDSDRESNDGIDEGRKAGIVLGSISAVLEDPDQFHYIKDVTSLNILRLGVSLTKQVYNQVFPSLSVTKLSMFAHGDPFYIDCILSMFPNLEELVVIGGENLTVRDDGDKDTVQRYLHLLLLLIKNGGIDQKFIDFFRMAVPNINTLNIAVTVKSLSNKEDFHLDISGWNLRLLNIALNSGSSKYSHFYNIQTESITKTIRYNPVEQTVTLVKEGQYFDTTEKLGDANIKCITHQHFMFHGFAVYLMHGKLVIAY
ncbi:hypothetical protein K501DRAFT_267482 [Backusella circina FSU 941]|nr:hypothetical protein K501DRAFT_267482 [Backusella circina FSU 941]